MVSSWRRQRRRRRNEHTRSKTTKIGRLKYLNRLGRFWISVAASQMMPRCSFTLRLLVLILCTKFQNHLCNHHKHHHLSSFCPWRLGEKNGATEMKRWRIGEGRAREREWNHLHRSLFRRHHSIYSTTPMVYFRWLSLAVYRYSLRFRKICFPLLFLFSNFFSLLLSLSPQSS